MSNNGGKGKFILGAAIGAIAGAVAGILFAPKSGKETRKIIGDKAKDYVEKGKEMVEKGTEATKEKIKEVADTVSKKMD
jgi:gas vesicle protein